MVPTKSKIIVRDWIPVWKRLGLMQLDIMLRKASVARVNRRLRRYYLIVRLLPNVFVKKNKRGACEQKAATVLPNRTAAT